MVRFRIHFEESGTGLANGPDWGRERNRGVWPFLLIDISKRVAKIQPRGNMCPRLHAYTGNKSVRQLLTLKWPVTEFHHRSPNKCLNWNCDFSQQFLCGRPHVRLSAYLYIRPRRPNGNPHLKGPGQNSKGPVVTAQPRSTLDEKRTTIRDSQVPSYRYYSYNYNFSFLSKDWLSYET